MLTSLLIARLAVVIAFEEYSGIDFLFEMSYKDNSTFACFAHNQFNNAYHNTLAVAVLLSGRLMICPNEEFEETGSCCFRSLESRLLTPGPHRASVVVIDRATEKILKQSEVQEILIPECLYVPLRPITEEVWIFSPQNDTSLTSLGFDNKTLVTIEVRKCERDFELLVDGSVTSLNAAGEAKRRICHFGDLITFVYGTVFLNIGSHNLEVKCGGESKQKISLKVGATPPNYICDLQLMTPPANFETARQYFSIPSEIKGDGMMLGYEQLFEAARLLGEHVPGAMIEIGTREGGGSAAMIAGMLCTCNMRPFFAVDPYGNIPYQFRQVETSRRPMYTNSMKSRMLRYMHQWTDQINVEFTLFPMESTEFFNRFHDGVPIYFDGKKKIMNEYALVFIDGQHALEPVLEEAMFFVPRIPVGGIIGFDDAHLAPTEGKIVSEIYPNEIYRYYDHGIVHKYLLDHGFKEIYTKSSYHYNRKRIYLRYEII